MVEILGPASNLLSAKQFWMGPDKNSLEYSGPAVSHCLILQVQNWRMLGKQSDHSAWGIWFSFSQRGGGLETMSFALTTPLC